MTTPGSAVKRGHILVSLPVLAIAAAAVVVMWVVGWPAHWSTRGLLAGVAAWPWWSYAVPRWRDWVETQGLSPDEVQPLAQKTGLVWPRGFILERTEFKRQNGRRGW